MTALAINCSHIKKSFKTKEVETVALRGIDLTVSKGEFVMLVGPSGCGKTTLISIIAGILHQDDGDCWVQGQNYTQMTASQLLDFRAKHIGFIFQSFNLIPTLSVVENVAIPLIITAQFAKSIIRRTTAKDCHRARLGSQTINSNL